MTPVEQTATSSGRQRRWRAASSTVLTEAAYPTVPVAQLALPALTMTARMRPFEAFKWALETTTGAATTRFCVKTAAAEAGTSLERSARSRAPVFFRPQAVAAKRNPRGRAASEGACFMGGGSAGRTRSSRKEPPILRVIGGCFDDIDDGAEAHGCFSSCARFCSSCAMAARTDSSAVPPGTDLEAMAASTRKAVQEIISEVCGNFAEICRRELDPRLVLLFGFAQNLPDEDREPGEKAHRGGLGSRRRQWRGEQDWKRRHEGGLRETLVWARAPVATASMSLTWS